MIPGSSSSGAYSQTSITDPSKTSKIQKQPEERLSENQCIKTPPIAIARGVNIVKYACLKDGCKEGYEKWSAARTHMRDVCRVEGKPSRAESEKKAKQFSTPKPDYVDPALESRFAEKLKKIYAPSEEELVNFVRNYYKGLDSQDKRKYVLSKIRENYGNFAFSKFGFETFEIFSKRHGLEVYGAVTTDSGNTVESQKWSLSDSSDTALASQKQTGNE